MILLVMMFIVYCGYIATSKPYFLQALRQHFQLVQEQELRSSRKPSLTASITRDDDIPSIHGLRKLRQSKNMPLLLARERITFTAYLNNLVSDVFWLQFGRSLLSVLGSALCGDFRGLSSGAPVCVERRFRCTVLFMTTVHDGKGTKRRRPYNATALIKKAWGSEHRKDLNILNFIDGYNHSMNGVYLADQARAECPYKATLHSSYMDAMLELTS